MSHYSGNNTKLQASGVHYGVPLGEPLKVEYDGREKGIKGSPKRPSTWSPCKWFCVVLAVLVSSFVIAALAAGTYGYFWTSRQVKRITVDKTKQFRLPIHDIPAEELEVIKDRAKLFYDQIEAGKVPEEDFTITADEINGFIAHSDFLRGHAFATISDANKVSMVMCLPAKGLPGGKDRYFVANGSIDISESDEVPGGALVTTQVLTIHPIDGVEGPFFFGQFLLYWLSNQSSDSRELVANIQSGNFMEYTVPEDYIAKKENLLDPHDQDEDSLKFLNGIQSISVTNGSITVHARRDSVYNSESSYSEQVSSAAIGGLRKHRRLSTSSSEHVSSTYVNGGMRKLKLLSKLFF